MNPARPRHRLICALAGGLLARAAGPALVLAALAGAAHAQSPVTTVFTYQGELSNGSGPVNNATADFKFRLYNNLTGPSQVGVELAASAVPLTNGAFTVERAFGH